VKRLLVVSVLLMLCASNALAASIGGRLGLTVRGGMTSPANQRLIDGEQLSTDKDFVYGGGLIYGISNNIATEFEVLYSKVNADFAGVDVADIKTTDISLGLQYRFLGTAPFQRAVPYVGAGVDVLVPSISFKDGSDGNIDPAVGAHLKGGVDLYITPYVALNAEVKGLLAAESDIRVDGVKEAKYDGSSFSGLVGLRLFFF